MDDKIGERIKKIIEKENLTPAEFAELVGIQRSAVSHFVTGRNKPRLEVIQKILKAFRLINPEWLILGYSPMYRAERQSQQPSLFDQLPEESDSKDIIQNFSVEENKDQKIYMKVENEKTEKMQEPVVVSAAFVPAPDNKLVKKIIVYYSDSTFEEFDKEKK